MNPWWMLVLKRLLKFIVIDINKSLSTLDSGIDKALGERIAKYIIAFPSLQISAKPDGRLSMSSSN